MNKPYNFLFKFIIVGDTSKPQFMRKASENRVCCFSILISTFANLMSRRSASNSVPSSSW